jgi:alpha-ketoglutarate-dependent taurine dioxygenase
VKISSGAERPNIGGVGVARRKPINLSQDSLISLSYLNPEKRLPLVIKPAVEGVNLSAFIESRRKVVNANLLEHGAILFRRFDVRSVADFKQFVANACGELLVYTDQTSPRHEVAGGVYTSTDHPADQSIFLHNENSYASTWPLKVFFYCQTPAGQGGETPIADTRRVLKRIDAATRERFIRKGWMLVRNFGDGFGLPWQTAFQTDDKTEVERYCHQGGIEFEWKDENRLRTRQVRQVVAKHPQTGEEVWFNHATFFHITTLAASIREALLAEFAEQDLPYNTYYGDGTPIESEVLEELREAYGREKVMFGWEQGDVLMVDNMMVAHGRSPYVGERKVLVGMAEPFSG